MSDQPLVCICIPVYNNESTIEDTIISILNQTYKNIIIKLYDNASTDNTVHILNKYKEQYSNVQLFRNSKNIGAEANFSECIKGLEGDFGAIFHADDIYNEKMVETQISYLSSNDISAVFVRADLIDDNSNYIGEQFFPDELKNKKYHQFNFEKLFALILKYDNFLITPSVMADIDIYKNQIKSWNGEKFKTSADLDAWLRFSEVKDIGIITDKLISYRMSTASFSYRTKFKRLVPRDMFLIIDYYLDKYKDSNFDRDDYEYLKFKDNILVISNKILNSKNVIARDIKLLNLKILNKVVFDNQKFKIYIYAALLKFCLVMNLKNILVKLVRKVNSIPSDIEFVS